MRASSIFRYWNWLVIAVDATATPRVPADLRPTSLRSRVFWGSMLALSLSLLAAPAQADVKQEVTKVSEKAVTGQVVWIGKRAISVETRRTEGESEEMLIPIDGKTAVERLKSLSELKPGDTVRVECKQTYKQLEDGSESLAATVATKIALVRSASSGALRSTGEGLSQ